MIIKIEEVGKIFIPMDYLQELRLNEGDEIEINLCEGRIIINRLIPSCILCNAAGKLVRYGRKCVCRNCIERLQKAKDGDFLYPIYS
ncbi:MAG: hypothetical protein FWH08_02690 [Oscillospiraceae bacterium]|nr:hypothetical protein [Oscillospiraceae bacterium]